MDPPNWFSISLLAVLLQHQRHQRGRAVCVPRSCPGVRWPLPQRPGAVSRSSTHPNTHFTVPWVSVSFSLTGTSLPIMHLPYLISYWAVQVEVQICSSWHAIQCHLKQRRFSYFFCFCPTGMPFILLRQVVKLASTRSHLNTAALRSNISILSSVLGWNSQMPETNIKALKEMMASVCLVPSLVMGEGYFWTLD